MKRLLLAVLAFPCTAALSNSEKSALDRISPDSLRGNLSFLASDALEGRGTPSRGLDIAAEFIAAQFRRAGLESIAKDGSYFQTANLTEVTPKMDGFQFTVKVGNDETELKAEDLRIRSLRPLDLKDSPVVTLSDDTATPIEGRVVVGQSRRYGTENALHKLQLRNPALILLIGRRVTWPASVKFLEERGTRDVPVITIAKGQLADAMDARRSLTVSLHLPAPATLDVTARNVGAILRGSDPAFRDQYVFLSAHYDHMGMLPPGEGDRIFNGANDNGSGTVSVMEIASALASMPMHPKRSIVFMAWYGEEEGLLGAFYYTHHPLFPLRNTVANINLEQMGRTDEQDGPQIGSFGFTGESFSNLPGIMTKAARDEDVSVYSKKGADAFFDRSDNYAFALAGIVAHTAVVAFEYPDYHAVGDEWEKIDYGNMARVDRAVAAGVIVIANAAEAPKWSDALGAASYRNAAK